MGPGAPKLNLTAEEKHIYGQLFRLADTDNVGVVTGEVAVKFFEKTRLDSRVLGEVGNPIPIPSFTSPPAAARCRSKEHADFNALDTDLADCR